MDEAADTLNELPDQILHHILAYLDTTELFQASLLSKRWEYLWMFVHTLNFNINLWKNKDRFIDYLEKVPYSIPKDTYIRSISIRDRKYVPANVIDTCIEFAVSRNVEELHLAYTGVLSNSFVGQVKSLILEGIRLLCPSDGLDQDEPVILSLPVVENLVLKGGVELYSQTQSGIEYGNFKSRPSKPFSVHTISSPRLKYLSVEDYIGVDELRLIAPNLNTVLVKKNLCRVSSSSEKFPCLITAKIDTGFEINNNICEQRKSVANLFANLNAFSNAEFLIMPVQYFQFWAATVVESLNIDPVEFHNVKYLKLTEWHIYGDIRPLAKFLESFPNLETLVLQRTTKKESFDPLKETRDWERQLSSLFKFRHLKNIKVQNFTGNCNEFKFLKFVARNALFLESIRFVAWKNQSDYKEKGMMDSLVTRNIESWGILPKLIGATSIRVKDKKKSKKKNPPPLMNGRSLRVYTELW
ncbi:hypothetical protein ACHQM5_015155 [Ranunculus cassubicifolius]